MAWRMGCPEKIRENIKLGHWLYHGLLPLEPIPDCFVPRVELLQFIAWDTDLFYRHDEAQKAAVRRELEPFIDDLRQSIEDYRAALASYDFLESLGGKTPFSREYLIEDLANRERASLAYDMNWSTT
jgi:hypothetical protein